MHRQLEFSFFMMRRTTRRWGLHSMLYAADPWGIAEASLSEYVPAGPNRNAARSFVHQAREYFAAADRAAAIETRPVLYYYSFLNLGKALAMARGRPGLVGRAIHGLAPAANTGHDIGTAQLHFRRSGPSSVSILDELHRALVGAPLPIVPASLAEVLPQSVVAHRLWREAANRRERFLPVEYVGLLHDGASRLICANLYVPASTMRVRGRTIADTAQEAALLPTFRAVQDTEFLGARYRTFEQSAPIRYGARPSDKVMDVVDVVRPLLWQTVTSAPPYRRYYLYLSPSNEQRFPQWLTIYSIFFWLGSLTRYQPVELFNLLDGPYGAFFREFLATQPSQLLYIFVSEIKRQDVARAAVV
jgi:hypothetical protein